MSEPEPSRPGSILRAEREALGVTVREVSETLNLSLAVIEAIEADDYDRLPGPVFARGYVRSYARLLELDPEPLVARYPRAADPTPMAGCAPERPIWEWIRRRPELVLGAAGALLAVFLILVMLWLWPEGDGEQDAGTEAAGQVEPGSSVEAEPAMSTARVPFQAAPGAATGNVHRITTHGDDRLAFTFTEDCWVEVRSATGASLYSDLSRGGSELVLVGQAPFRILLGYAPAAELAFNGEPMPLAPHTRDNVATLVLGH